MALLDK